MAALMRSTDWPKTKLGPAEDWPRSLKTMLGVILGSRFPMLLWWGPDMLHLYNDAYRPILRDKHPASLAAPAAQVWAEVWDLAGPMARSVQEGGPATWTEDLQLFINSGAMLEETYFTFSYSPVPGDDGRVGGILNTVQETTAKVQIERQIRMLHDLAARAADAKSEQEAYRITAEVLSTNELDLPFALLYVLNEKADGVLLAGVSGLKDYEGAAKRAYLPINESASAASWPVAEAIRTAREIVIDNVSARFGPLPVGRWNARPEQAILLPLSRAGQSMPYAVLVAGISPHRALDERYQRFFRATADQVMTVIANARTYESEKKRAEALADIDRAKTTFFSNVSHEFRTPLTLMLGPLEDALADSEQPLPRAQQSRMRLAHDNALRLLKLVTALLDFSRLEAGRMSASYAPLDIAQFTAELAGMFQSAVDKGGLKLVVDCPRLSEPVWVDRDMWEKIVSNLVTNAFKFTLAGEIVVRTREEGSRIALEVSDTGVGIPEAELPRIFDRFHRVAGTVGRTHEGTGIGLSLVRELVQLHAGNVSVQSAVGRGTTFRVEIPKGRAHLPAEAVSNEPKDPRGSRNAEAYAVEATRWAGGARAAVSTPTQPEAKAAARPRALVVDDNADLREYISGLLTPIYEVTTAPDGLAALEAIRATVPDVVVSDVMMPRLDGFGLVRALRQDPATASIPVILLSARAGEEESIEGLDSGADDYLAKPFSARELLARVRTHLELQRARRAWISQLSIANRELEAFSYSVSHDLRAPLRTIEGFSRALVEDCAAQLGETGQAHIERIFSGVDRMGTLIDALLELARVTRAEIKRGQVDLSKLAAEIVAEFGRAHPERKVQVQIEEGLLADGDSSLLGVVLTNLLGNAWKFTARNETALITFGRHDAHEPTFFVRDNGAGFDPNYASKLFTPFQRLHTTTEFEGTGVGLATVQRVIHRHSGRIWAEGAVGKGATFYFSIPKPVR